MRSLRLPILVVLLAIVAASTWYYVSHRAPSAGETIPIYYTKVDGKSLAVMRVSMRPRQPDESAAERLHNVVLYAAVQAIAGPPNDVQAIRIPRGTQVLDVSVNGSTATLDLSKDLEKQAGGTFGENGEFKALVYTITGIKASMRCRYSLKETGWRRCREEMLNWTNRFIARTGKLASALSPMLAALAIAVPAFADSSLTATYQGRTIVFTQLSSRAGAPPSA